jgi:aldose sugar dehydrogenase
VKAPRERASEGDTVIVDDNDRNAGLCRCPGCPTTDDCMKDRDGRLYCARGETDCDPSGRGCLCSDCPVSRENRFGGRYFCIEGPAR